MITNFLNKLQTVVGQDGALAVIREFGGIRVFVPRNMTPTNKWAKLLGSEKACRLSARYGGKTLSIPRGKKRVQQKRNREIIHQYDAGIPVRKLARDYQLTDRQIYKILSKPIDSNDGGG